MLNQLVKITLWASLWLWLKPRWRALLALAVFVLIVHVAHNEYLGYVELSGERAFLAWSYVVKWLALVMAALFYLGFSLRRGVSTSAAQPVKKRQAGTGESSTADDGFDFLREKTQLRTEAEQVIERKAVQKDSPGQS